MVLRPRAYIGFRFVIRRVFGVDRGGACCTHCREDPATTTHESRRETTVIHHMVPYPYSSVVCESRIHKLPQCRSAASHSHDRTGYSLSNVIVFIHIVFIHMNTPSAPPATTDPPQPRLPSPWDLCSPPAAPIASRCWRGGRKRFHAALRWRGMLPSLRAGPWTPPRSVPRPRRSPAARGAGVAHSQLAREGGVHARVHARLAAPKLGVRT